MMMPQMDGRETIRRLRQLPDGRRTPVIVMSAAVSAEHAGEGMAAFIAKPFDLVALLDTIASVLDGEAPETLSNPS
jgi:CheY-like chemotaxis protein